MHHSGDVSLVKALEKDFLPMIHVEAVALLMQIMEGFRPIGPKLEQIHVSEPLMKAEITQGVMVALMT